MTVAIQKEYAEKIVETHLAENVDKRSKELEGDLAFLRQSAMSLNDPLYEAWALYIEGMAVMRFEDMDKGYKLLTSALRIFEASDHIKGIGYTCNLISVRNLLQGNFAEAITVQMRALEAAKQIGNARIEGSSYTNIGNAYHALGDNTKALKYFNLALINRQEAGDRRREALAYNNIAGQLVIRGNYTEALKKYHLSGKLRSELNDKTGLGEVHENLGNLHELQNNTDEALKDYLISLAYYQEADSARDIAYQHLNIGRIYMSKARYDEARHHFSMARPILEQINDQTGTALYQAHMGDIEAANKGWEKALEYYDAALLLNEQTGHKEGFAKVQLARANVHIATKAFDKAIALLTVAERCAEEMNNTALLKDCAQAHVDAYRGTDDYKQALHYHEEFHRLSAVLMDAETRKQLTDLNFQHNLVQTEKDLELEKVARKSEQEKNMLLSTQKDLIEKSLQEREMLLREIHHRVKNNLQTISSLLDLQSRSIDDAKAKGAIKEGQNRVRSIALIHQNLYRHENLKAIEFSQFINDLSQSIRDVFLPPGQTFEFINGIPELFLDIDTAVPLGLISNELLTNSFKYASPSSGHLQISVGLREIEEGRYTFEQHDNGCGLTPGLDTEHVKTLGLRLVHRLTEQLDGELQYSYDNGATFSISFKDTEARKREL